MALEEPGVTQQSMVLKRDLCGRQEATVRTRHGDTGSFPIGRGVTHGCILSAYWFSLYAERILQMSGLDSEEGVKIGGR